MNPANILLHKANFSELNRIVEKINNFQIIRLKFPHLYDILELTICEVYYGKFIRKDTKNYIYLKRTDEQVAG